MKSLKIISVTIAILILTVALMSSAAAHGPYPHPPRFRSGFHRVPPRLSGFSPVHRYPPRSQLNRPPIQLSPFSAPSDYIVRRGDTLAGIARRSDTSVRAILAANPQIRNPNRIFTGQRLRIPRGFVPLTQPRYGGGAYGSGAYGGTKQPQAPGRVPGITQGQAQVVMQNVSFQPQQIRVAPGTMVRWVNQDGFAHTVTAGTRGNPSGLFNSGNISAGGSFSFTFQESGTYNYFCSIHDGMNGVVIVEEGVQQPMAPQQQAPSPGGGYSGGGY